MKGNLSISTKSLFQLFWEISGNNQSARIEDMTQERALIHYADGMQARLVKQVDWKDLEGRVRQVDHYNRFRSLFCYNDLQCR